jgi:pimeloyl-ACP methyl ester carboxylesterase
MPSVSANAIRLEYDTFGDPTREPLLLVMGLGTQMILWREEFCERLAASGHYVIRYDNRDVGLSTKFDDAGVPDLPAVVTRVLAGLPAGLAYTLDDMADDAAGLLDALQIDRAHVCGASMGGMIAQTVAIRHPHRVKTLTSIMSTTGDPSLPPPTLEAVESLLEAPPADRDAYLERSVRLSRVIGSPGFDQDEATLRTLAGRAYDRCFYPQGQARHLAAVLAHGSRRDALSKLRVPSLVIHGADDPLVRLEGGEDTAAAIPDAELVVIDGMGHDLPPGVWPPIIAAVSRLTQSATAAAA